MHMKSTHSADSSAQTTTGSTKKHIVSRLHKASRYARHLLSLLEHKEKSDAKPQTVFEASAYLQSLQGAIHFEKREWENCLRSYAETRLIYTALAQQSAAKQGDIFRDLLSKTVDPSIRFAAYQLKLPRTTSTETLVARYISDNKSDSVNALLKSNPDILGSASSRTKKEGADIANIPKTISWRSRTVNIEDAATAQALASVSAAERNLAAFLASHQESDRRTKAAAYDDVLLPSQDAVDATKTAIDEMTAEGVAQGDPRMQSLQVTRTAVNYALIGWRVGRNRILCGEQDGSVFDVERTQKPKKPRKNGKEQEESRGRKLTRLRERVVLYDATIQSLDS
ncbi:MAG: hypothetical protein Q9190_008049, partial [Brigantiaea leucoxantha]